LSCKIFDWGLYSGSGLKAALQKLKPKLSIRLWPYIASLGQALQQSANDRIDSGRITAAAAPAAWYWPLSIPLLRGWSFLDFWVGPF
jgi:hypothetical protein